MQDIEYIGIKKWAGLSLFFIWDRLGCGVVGCIFLWYNRIIKVGFNKA